MSTRRFQIVAGAVALSVIAWWGAWNVFSEVIPRQHVQVERADDQPGRSVVGRVVVNQPTATPTVDLGIRDDAGAPLTASCSTCHSTQAPNRILATSGELNKFHQGLTYVHGGLSCLSCHHEDNYDMLRLASGKQLEFVDVMTLCSQCHGPQRRDFDHGAHGGMTGHWDLSRGERVRNNCVDCHDPHAPAFPQMLPTFKPRDRFLESHTHGDDESHE